MAYQWLTGARAAAAIIGAALLLGLGFDGLFYDQALGINFVLYIALIIGLLLALARGMGQRLNDQAVWLFIPLIFFSSMIFVRANPFLTFLNVVACIFLLCLVAQLASGRRLIGSYASILLLPRKFLRPLLITLNQATELLGKTSTGKAKPIVKGLFLALPFLLVFGLLFASADLVFQEYLTNIITIHISPNLVSHLLLIGLVTIGFIGAYAYALTPPSTAAVTTKAEKPVPFSLGLGRIELSILLGSINALFALFVMLQLAYLFGGESVVKTQDFTYAEYARRGFFELIAVAVLTLGLLRATELSVIKNAVHARVFKLFGGILIVQTLVIMVSAFKRLALYEQAYGLTTPRFYSHAFIVLLGCVMVLFLYKLIRGGHQRLLATGTVVLTLVFLAGINVLNPDAFIARRNIGRFYAGNKFDAYYLVSLSPDATPEIVKTLEGNNQTLKEAVRRELSLQLQNKTSFNQYSDWQSFNISRYKAAGLLDKHFNLPIRQP